MREVVMVGTTDDFGDRMKEYEAEETDRTLNAYLPIVARLDGRAFSSFTRGMDRPFDAGLTRAMIETTRTLIKTSHAKIGYTQSDEISLVFQAGDTIFGSKVHKMTSVFASLAAAQFSAFYPSGLPHFDCRVFNVPNETEAANAILWRAMDARKNAVNMVAQHHFSHRALQGKGQGDMLAMIAEAGINFDSYPLAFGTFLRRVTKMRTLTNVELERIPLPYRPTGPVLRSSVVEIDMPPFNTVKNRVGVIFGSEEPKT